MNNVIPKSVSFEKGDVIFHMGEVGECGYIIESGQVEISVNESGQSKLITILERGEIFGEMAIIDESVRSATARCLTPCRLLVVSKEQLNERIMKADPVLRMLLLVLTQRLRNKIGAPPLLNRLKKKILQLKTPGDPENFALKKMSMESELRAAEDHNELLLHYQPIVHLKSGLTVGYEALIRWQSPKFGFVRPDDFIGLSEETDLIIPIGRWIVRRAVADLARMQATWRGTGDLFMSINVSPRQFDDSGFFSCLLEALDESKVRPEQIKLEITESVVSDVEKAEAWIQMAKNHGLNVSLDDFGSGYSSLGCLSQLQIDYLKLDRSFVSRLLTDPNVAIVAQSVVTMANNLNIPVIAEGIEDREHADYLNELKCSYGQGYLFAKPRPIDEILDEFDGSKLAA